MEQIFVESSKSYRHGFVLKEQELRRIIDLINEQLKKISNDDPIEYSFRIKYKNGAIAKTNELESILKQENEGSASIVRLEINGLLKKGENESIIKLIFKNPDLAEDESEIPIKHIIKGQSRDWVFVTSSLIEERISKIKRKQFDPTAKNGSGRLLFKLSSPIFMLILMIAMFASVPETSDELSIVKNKAITEIERKWESKIITDPVDAIIQLEKAKNNAENKISTNRIMFGIFLSKPFLIIIGGLVLLMIFMYIYFKYYPAYNFYWGNYMEIFDKKENVRKLIIGIFLVTIVLGVVVNLLSNAIWTKI